MTGILIVFPKAEDGKSIRNLLVRHGYDVAAVCTLGSQVLNSIDMMNSGIIISGYKYPDMYYGELAASLPEGFEMLLLASARICAECADPDIVCVTMPLKVQDLMSTLEMMCMNQMRRKKKLRSQPKKRSEAEKRILREAKEVLMERNRMTEEDAHRYLQKCSMDSGTSIVETAQMVLAMIRL
ncbi:MAG: ANTAR domain-containing protein [Lachnospiraceae bacterium]